jgi:hypothetical protein
VSRARFGESFDLVAESQEPLAGEVEAVVGSQFAVGDIDEDPFLEIEQLENRQGVSLAVDGAQVVPGELEVGARGQDEVMFTGVAGEEGGGEVGARDREATLT